MYTNSFECLDMTNALQVNSRIVCSNPVKEIKLILDTRLCGLEAVLMQQSMENNDQYIAFVS